MAFRKERALSGREFATGYLDDPVIMSFGSQDKTCHFVEVTVAEILKDHRQCSDVMSKYEEELKQSAKPKAGAKGTM